ncbi:MAG: hypothetical protein A2Y82_04910 [Candidatus Buchananbacteria bacterium RBG_13_36_9]|uniref:Uncharacterized protein n=1 Tax=Candidatus Buchananbacteria bacterium RBG_13_36_9 TaxID=1797530 RepID=A0A1G1XQB9_9BACT|nr:MAG: hypothetical protein A2Y82_04910 [Candidatus Buchananbacteria bacterium RBG_13_36_9]
MIEEKKREIFFCLCQETQEEEGTNIFSVDDKNYSVANLYPTKEEVVRIKGNYKLTDWLIARVIIANINGKKKVEFIKFEDN